MHAVCGKGVNALNCAEDGYVADLPDVPAPSLATQVPCTSFQGLRGGGQESWGTVSPRPLHQQPQQCLMGLGSIAQLSQPWEEAPGPVGQLVAYRIPALAAFSFSGPFP